MTYKQSILIVEDDKRLADLISEYLTDLDYHVGIECYGDIAVTRILDENPDLVILDLMLPGKDGFSVCRDIRNEYKGLILILTAREDDIDQVAGLELGADDYVKKPIEPRVLLARIRALFRRSGNHNDNSQVISTDSENGCIEYGHLKIVTASRSVFLMENEIKLSTSEFDLLQFLASKAGEILDRDAISSHLRGIDYDGFDRSIDVCISRLRKKLGDNSVNPKKIKTIWGSGYLFVKTAWGE
jgi:DNA-binding response OmpR family regulator